MNESIDCFHCGELVPPYAKFSASVDGDLKPMCCLGCQEVTKTILASGLNDYYRFRTEKAQQPQELFQELEQHLGFDAPEVQQVFVHAEGDFSEATLSIEGITCAACAWLIESKVKRLLGVVSFHVNASSHRALVKWDSKTMKLSDILKEIHQLGYSSAPFLMVEPERNDKKEHQRFLFRLGMSGLATMQVMMLAFALYSGYFTGIEADLKHYLHWVSLWFTLPVVTYCAWPFYRSAFLVLKQKHVNMDVSVSLAVLLAFVASCFATWNEQGTVYFESVSMFVFFMLISRSFEQKARHKATQRANNLYKNKPLTAQKIQGNRTHSVPANALQVGDQVHVAVGETIPADGLVVQGVSGVEESLLTGEHMPVTKRRGDWVFGTSINLEQPLVVDVRAVGADQVVGQMVQQFEQAVQSKPRLARVAEKVARYFIPFVLLTAFFTYFFWWHYDASRALSVTLSVLIATCPCALALATPTSLTCAVSSLQKLGLIVRSPDFFERFCKISHVIFDKTGTLTTGTFDVTAHHFFGEQDFDRVLNLVCHLEQGAGHPIAKAFLPLQADHWPTLEVVAKQVSVGQGVSASVEGVLYRLGSASYTHCTPYQAMNVYLTADDELIAAFLVEDRLRSDAVKAVKLFHQHQIKVSLLSGDHEKSVRSIAKLLDIDIVLADQSPEQKLRHLQKLQQQGDCVAMIGDGVNDAPTLSAAYLSVAMGSGAAMTQSQADMILASNRLAHLSMALGVTQKTMRIIHQNLLWALFYNFAALPLAVTGALPPYLAALGMSLSSLLVTMNSLRLLKVTHKL
jgi:Cu2+-exporting ATPase